MTQNMEENEKSGEGKEKVDLGALQYSIEFDFQKNEVRLFAVLQYFPFKKTASKGRLKR